jgi:hypothetical protein
MRILAFTPTWDDAMRPETRLSMQDQELDGLDLEWCVSKDNPYKVPDHRNVLHQYTMARKRVLDEGFDALWTVEHDMIVPPHAVTQLVATPGDVVYGIYLLRWGTYVLNAFEYINQKNIGESLSLFPEKAQAARKKGVVKVSGAGWGCTLVRRKVLEALEFPKEWPENPAYDITFAQRALRARFTMLANFNVLCGHMKGDVVLYPFLNDEVVEHDRPAFVVGGQLMIAYRKLGGSTLRVRALQTLNTQGDNGETLRLARSKIYDLPISLATELARAGYVEALAHVP